MSDQDFFFDDDVVEKAPEKRKPVKSSGGTKAKSSRQPVRAYAPSDPGVTITATVCALIAIIALLIGIIGGIFIGKSLTPPTTVPTGTSSSTPMGGMTAPELTDEQMQQGMPAGHPDISNMQNGDSTTTDGGAATDGTGTDGATTNP